jgi:hypothetical protein
VCKGGGPTVTIPEADQAWLSVSDIRMIPGVPDPQFPTVAVPDTAVVTMKAVANAAGARTSTVAFGSTSLTTTAPAAILALCPTVMGPSTFAPEPTITPFSSVGWRLPVSLPVPPRVTP